MKTNSIIGRRTVSKPFRDILIKTYRKMDDDLMPLLCYLLFPTRLYDGKILVSQNTMAQIMGHRYVPATFSVQAILQRMQHHVFLEWSNYNVSEGKARVIESIDWPKHITQALESERKHLFLGERVYLFSGKPFSKKLQYEQMRLEMNDAREVKTHNQAVQPLLDYMNGIPSNIFAEIVKRNGAKTLDCILGLDKDTEHQWNIFSSIVDDYVQPYQPTPRSVRIYPVGEKIVSLKKEVRKVLTDGWVECDLKSAQFAIVATLWDIPSVQKFLEEEKSIWDYLCIKKETAKTALYTLCYGGGKRELQKILGTDYDYFMKLPLIKDIKQARQHQLKKIKAVGGAIDCFGNFISVDEMRKLGSKHPELSVLAQLSQSLEMKLLLPVVELAQQHSGSHGFTITLWQHDGFTFKANRTSDTEKWLEKLKDAVAREAEKVSVNTCLVR